MTKKHLTGGNPLSLYFHIPFCKSRCGYCNFYSTGRLGEMERYVAALCRAVASAPLAGREAVTIYFGGGTPSLLGEGLLTILDAVRAAVPIAPDAEITLEANPATITPALLQKLRRGGFNRISYGLQSADDSELRVLGRSHSALEGAEAVREARAAGFNNISVDIMLGTPGQDVDGARRLCAAAVALGVEHISAYMLKIEPDTPFGKGNVVKDCADADEAADIYLAACDELRGAGYRHYEISNFALEGFQSRHNTVYWQLGDYLGIGCAAYSLLKGRRFHFPPDLDAFLQADDAWSLAAGDGMGGGLDEYLMLSLRLDSGLDTALAARRYGADPARLLARAGTLAGQGLLRVEDGCIKLTNSGFLVSNSVINYLSDGVC